MDLIQSSTRVQLPGGLRDVLLPFRVAPKTPGRKEFSPVRVPDRGGRSSQIHVGGRSRTAAQLHMTQNLGVVVSSYSTTVTARLR